MVQIDPRDIESLHERLIKLCVSDYSEIEGDDKPNNDSAVNIMVDPMRNKQVTNAYLDQLDNPKGKINPENNPPLP